MTDLVLDTGPLADLLGQYFHSQNRNSPVFAKSEDISQDEARQINRLVQEQGSTFIVAASALAFVEMVYNWDTLVADRFSEDMLAAFIADPPDWFSILPVNNELINYFCDVPSAVQMKSGNTEQIEWTDAVHAATALMREKGLLVTTDRRLLIWVESNQL